jgi:hypothetical protein
MIRQLQHYYIDDNNDVEEVEEVDDNNDVEDNININDDIYNIRYFRY